MAKKKVIEIVNQLPERETVLYAVKIGEPDYAEVILTAHADRVEDAKKWGAANGFDRFRVAVIDLTVRPDFGKTIRRK